MEKEEIWKTHPVLGIEVSNKGRVFIPKVKGHPEHITYGSDKSNGYKMLEYKGSKYLIHRLVAETFLPNADNLPCVNHKDENKSNNCVDNLEWCTHRYNNVYGTRVQRMVEKLSKPVYQYTKDGVLVNRWTSVNECGRNGYCFQTISKCCLGKLPHYKGFIWSYEKKV